MAETKQREVKEPEPMEEAEVQQQQQPGVPVTVRPERPLMPRVVLICGEGDDTHNCPEGCHHYGDANCRASQTTESYYCLAGEDKEDVQEPQGRFHREVDEHLRKFDSGQGDVLFACMCRVTIAEVTGVVMRVEPTRIHFQLAIRGPELGDQEVLSEEDNIATDIEGMPWFLGDSYADVKDAQGRKWTVLCAGAKEEKPLVDVLYETSMQVAHHRNHYVNSAGYRHMTCRHCFGDRTALCNLLALQRIREMREILMYREFHGRTADEMNAIKQKYAPQKGDMELRLFAKQLLSVPREKEAIIRRYEEIMRERREEQEKQQ